jgi:hypothetical protein
MCCIIDWPPYVERVVGDCQCGFHQGRSRTEQIFNVCQVLEKCKEVGIEMHHLFIDFKAAYDSIDRTRLYLAMEEMQIPKKLINLVRVTMRNTEYQIRIQSTLSESLLIKKSPSGRYPSILLFNVALEKVIRDVKINTRGNIFYKSVQIFACADDIDIVGQSQAAMKEAFISLEKVAKEMNLHVNQEKTKYMPVTKKDYAHIPSHIEIGPYQFETA